MPRIIAKAPLRGTSQPKTQDPGAKLVYDDVMLREPRLLVPKLSPIGNVRIDWRNPLARGLIIFVLPGMFLEVVTGTRGGGLESSGTIAASTEGLGCESTSTTAGGCWIPYHLSWQALATTQLTIMARLRKDASNQYGGLVSIPYANSGWSSPYASIALQHDATAVTPAANLGCSGAQIYSAGLSSSWPNDGLIANYWFTRSLANGAWYKDNAACGTSSGFGTAAPTINPLCAMSIGNRSRYSNGNGIDGNFGIVALWNRVLSDGELRAFNADPYQFLIPA